MLWAAYSGWWIVVLVDDLRFWEISVAHFSKWAILVLGLNGLVTHLVLCNDMCLIFHATSYVLKSSLYVTRFILIFWSKMVSCAVSRFFYQSVLLVGALVNDQLLQSSLWDRVLLFGITIMLFFCESNPTYKFEIGYYCAEIRTTLSQLLSSMNRCFRPTFFVFKKYI